MKTDVEILASTSLAATDIAEIESEFARWGLRARTSQLPARRGVADYSWLLLMTVPAEILVRKLLEGLGNEAYQRLRDLVERMLARYRHSRGDGRPAPTSVVIESAATGTQFALEADLPLEAYLQLFEELREPSSTDGLRIFNRERRRWSPSAAA